ncbi:MAG TPA: bifunctional DNA-formamidopyrimidine glycosylase/DNA-(apurinic or apyrimidinic site) lyase [Candidatus Angelobacter sp.]|nr:bifunctional DNA-formamidopyrimidine glycosylase/DNA-(apurinic or apyrimidinic site) lyase [Candidatus Angelobacter sp.]
MPELPEVETIARGLAKRVTGDVIESVWIGSKPEPLKSSARAIAALLEGGRIERVHRAGKHIVIDLSRGRVAGKDLAGHWIVHLGMTGRLLIADAHTEVVKHTHLIAKLASGRELRFVDPRRFGRLSVVKPAGKDQNGNVFAGTEPLEIGFQAFAALFRKRDTPVKSALLNQKLLRGVGNIYADESLFRAKVRPRRRAGKLTQVELQRLHAAIQQVLREAIAAGGSSVSDYVDASGEEGFFQLRHRVYGREGEPCLVCKTPIKRVVIGGRSSHYCPKCQK